MSVFARALVTLHNDRHMGEAASYQRASGAPIALRVIWSAPSDVVALSGVSSARAIGRHASVLAADLAGVAPVRGDLVTIGGTTYRVDDAEQDVLHLSHVLTLVRANNIGQFAIGSGAIGGPQTIG